MKDKLEVGMFYRYKGQIGKYKKITELDRHPSFTNNYLRESETILLNNAKFSYNIIDILEVGDYVNGSKVQEIRKNYIEIEEYSGLNNDEPCILKSEDIKSIVTKEQFEQMAYKVGE